MLARWLAGLRLVGALLPLLACSADTLLIDPGQSSMRPPYLAIVISVDAPPEITARGPYRFRVRELSGTLPVDTSFSAAAKDTVIFHVEPATYRVDVSDVPPTCGVRDGTAQAVVVPPNTNTSLVRFFITCTPALVVTAYTDGAQPDSNYILAISSPGKPDQASIIPANDTVRFEGLSAGTYTLSLRHVADNCVILSDGGAQFTVTIGASGGAFVAFRIVCSEPARRPRVARIAASYAAGSIGYVVHAIDPDKDVERTFIDVTDCNRKSVLANGGNRRGGFSGFPNVTRRDTAVIIGAYDLGIADSDLRDRCVAVWVADERGNTSEFVEVPLVARDPARSPAAVGFNARLNGTRSLQVQLAVTDPNQDFLGLFAVYLLRDGIIIFPADGQPDRLIPAPAGLLGSTIDELPMGIGFGAWNDYIGAIVYLVDAAGNFTRLQDDDLFR